jgi:hypothetical protein
VVSEVRGSAFSLNSGSGQHLVELTSIEEDALGEEIQVVWQMEAGAQVLEKAGLPSITGWDSDDRLEAFLDAVRWGAITNADRSFLQSPFRSGITIEDYQLDPLVRAVEMARVNLLIADDVGLGKTIEAGLVIQELLVRHRARTVFVVCPASLQVKWQTEMQEKFGLEFRIVDTEYVKRLRRERGIHVNPWTSYPRLVTSMDWMKSGEGFRLLKDVLPPHITYPRKFDILVVDEAHNVAPASASMYALESQRTRLIRSLAPHFTHRLFLSATPHNGYQESFTSLLELLDDQRFARTVMPDEKQLHRVMVRRLKSDIVDANGKPVFPVRKLEGLEIDYSEEERQIHALLGEYTADRSKSVKGTRFEYGTDFVHMLLKKRLFSSPMAFALTLAKHRDTLERGKPKGDRDTMDDRILRKAILKTEEEYSDDSLVEEAQHEAVEVVGELAPPSVTRAERHARPSLRMGGESTQPRRLESQGHSRLAREPSEDGWALERKARDSVHRIPGHPFVAPSDSHCQRLRRRSFDVPARKHAAGRARVGQSRVPGASGHFTGSHPARDRRGLGRYRPAEPLQLPHPCRDSVEPECHGTAQRPYRPPRAEGRRRLHLASGGERLLRESCRQISQNPAMSRAITSI